MPALGLGTWHLGEQRAREADEVAALRAAFEMGYRVVDTAEMYGAGGAERVVGTALAQATRAGTLARDDVFIVSKVLPSNASAAGVVAACERSRERLGVDAIDLYLLHWRGGVPLKATLQGFETLLQRGWIRHWGVSNFDASDLRELAALPGGDACTANQVWYSLGQRGPAFELMSTMQRGGMVLMAYCPLDEGRLAAHAGLQRFARERGCTAAQLALAWLMTQPGVMAIPKSSNGQRLRENWESQAITLTQEDHAKLDGLFPPPRRASSLAMI